MYYVYVKEENLFDSKRLIGEYRDIDKAYERADKEVAKNPAVKYSIEESNGNVDNYGELITTVVKENQFIMAIEKVREHLAQFGAQNRILEFETSSATVELAAVARKQAESQSYKDRCCIKRKSEAHTQGSAEDDRRRRVRRSGIY